MMTDAEKQLIQDAGTKHEVNVVVYTSDEKTTRDPEDLWRFFDEVIAGVNGLREMVKFTDGRIGIPWQPVTPTEIEFSPLRSIPSPPPPVEMEPAKAQARP